MLTNKSLEYNLMKYYLEAHFQREIQESQIKAFPGPHALSDTAEIHIPHASNTLARDWSNRPPPLPPLRRPVSTSGSGLCELPDL